jgi:poly-beta-1,6-N-acetyl-D-glucosamine N-deacetylase
MTKLVLDDKLIITLILISLFLPALKSSQSKLINVNFLKNQNLPLQLVLLLIVVLSFLNLKDKSSTVSILGFHGVVDNISPASRFVASRMDYPKQDLEQILDYLVSNNYWFLTTQDLYDYFLTRSKKIPKEHLKQKPIMISFDDGYKTIHTNLLPILSRLEKKYNQRAKVVLFINPGNLAKKGKISATHLGCQELREGLEKGFYDIQSHGLTHKDLTQLNSRELVNELLQAQLQLRKCTKDLDPDKKVASHFAYPYGIYNERVKSYVSKYYLSSYLYNNKPLSYTCSGNHYEIPRLIVSGQTPFVQLLEVAEGLYQIKEKC